MQAELLPLPKPRKFRLTPLDPSEQDLHETTAELLDAILLPPAMWFAYPAGFAELTPSQQAKYFRMGVKEGIPEIWICHDGVYTLELKSKTGKLSRTKVVRTKRGRLRIRQGQADVFPKLLATGAIRAIEIARSVDEVVHWLDVWGVPHRPVF